MPLIPSVPSRRRTRQPRPKPASGRAGSTESWARPRAAERDLARLKAAFARLDGHLATRRYLVGERFSRADLTLAALAGGILRPVEHPAEQYPSRGSLPGWLEQTRPLRESTTAERVRELYRTERRVLPLATPAA